LIKLESRKKDSGSEFATLFELPIKNLFETEEKFIVETKPEKTGNTENKS